MESYIVKDMDGVIFFLYANSVAKRILYASIYIIRRKYVVVGL